MNNIRISVNHKKHKINQKEINKDQPRSSKRKILIVLIFIFILLGGYFAYGRWQRLQSFNKSITPSSDNQTTPTICNDIFNPKCWSEAFKPTLEQYNNKTGVLIVGLDTREEGGVEQGLQNTDSIIVALFDHTTKKTSLISFPRDLYVPYYINGKGPYHSRINAIYSTGEQRTDIDDGFDLLQDTVERITGEKIQYRVIVRLKGVEDIIDAVGGLDIEIPTYLKVKYPNDYPGQDGKPYNTWLYYEFKPGLQHLDGEHALVWMRFRKVVKGDLTYASDFSRAQRQQQVIDALKEKALADEDSTSQKAKKYWDILQTAGKNIELKNIGLEEILAGFYLAKDVDTDPINIVLDPNFGGLNQFIYHPSSDLTGGAYYIKIKDETFKKLQDFLQVIWKYPKIYDEQAVVVVENKTGKNFSSTDKISQLKKLITSHSIPIISNNFITLTKRKSDKKDIVIVDYSNGKKAHTAKYLVDFLDAKLLIEDPQNYEYKQTNYKEDIKVIVNPPTPTETVN